VTDGTSLFRVEHGALEDGSGEHLIELENCSTLEIILCPARAVGVPRLRVVTPTPQPGGSETALDIIP
jgi:hypothetical protein